MIAPDGGPKCQFVRSSTSFTRMALEADRVVAQKNGWHLPDSKLNLLHDEFRN